MAALQEKAHKVIRKVRNAVHRGPRVDREVLASVYLRGSGIEIGALQGPLRVPRAVKVRYVDRMTVADLRKQYPELKYHKLVDVDIIDDGESLSTIGDASQDFVIAIHFLEHCENPIKAVSNFVRVVREGGFFSFAFQINDMLSTKIGRALLLII